MVKKLRPVVIFAGVHTINTWFEKDLIPDWLYTTSPSGWTSTDIMNEWIEKVFLPDTQPTDPNEWRLLIMDGHKSYTPVLLMKKCKDQKVWIAYLPAYYLTFYAASRLYSLLKC